jgi:dihydroorotase
MEHITTEDAVNFVSIENKDNINIAATITAHHLLYNRNHIFTGGICPHMYCLPILKRESHRYVHSYSALFSFIRHLFFIFIFGWSVYIYGEWI